MSNDNWTPQVGDWVMVQARVVATPHRPTNALYHIDVGGKDIPVFIHEIEQLRPTPKEGE